MERVCFSDKVPVVLDWKDFGEDFWGRVVVVVVVVVVVLIRPFFVCAEWRWELMPIRMVSEFLIRLWWW